MVSPPRSFNESDPAMIITHRQLSCTAASAMSASVGAPIPSAFGLRCMPSNRIASLRMRPDWWPMRGNRWR